MVTVVHPVKIKEALDPHVRLILQELGGGRADGTAYDTAWVGRLATRYPHQHFTAALDWLRRNQLDDGTWGAPSYHHHDRYISTLAAMLALHDAGDKPRDARLIEFGRQALWRIVGKLERDDQDTIGFPLLSVALTKEAQERGYVVPLPTPRYAKPYQQRVDALLAQQQRDWRVNTLAFSIEGLYEAIEEHDIVLESNQSAGTSIAATAGYLLRQPHDGALHYVINAVLQEGTGAAPVIVPIDLFEIGWTINHLRYADAITPDDPHVRPLLDVAWQAWQQMRGRGVGFSSHYSVPDVDTTAAIYMILKWCGYPVRADVFRYYEKDDCFCTFPNETDPSTSANVRTLAALRMIEDDHPYKQRWIEKAVTFLQAHDRNGAFWVDKWHTSPYYVNATAIWALHGYDNALRDSRCTWIQQTQNDDGGWGYHDVGISTPEETAYCLEALLWYDAHVQAVDDAMLGSAVTYLLDHMDDDRFTPLWIGKSLYTPHYPVKSAIIGALYNYKKRSE
jgi:halimadienyl-diphosphate synthase